jgi:hypothetical protein
MFEELWGWICLRSTIALGWLLTMLDELFGDDSWPNGGAT